MTDRSDHVLQVEDVTKRFGDQTVLDRVNLTLRSGTVHALVGENGAGKSTLINVMSGAYRPDGGRLLLDGRPIAFGGPHEAIRAGISTVHQELSLFPDQTVAENLCSHREPVNALGFVRWRTLRAQATAALARVGSALDPFSLVSDLPIAAQQLVEIARVVSRQARALVLDEPTSALSSKDAAALFAIIADLRARGVAILFVSHKLPEVLAIADEVTVLRDGRVVGHTAAAAVSANGLVRLMVGRDILPLQNEPAAITRGPVLDVRGLSRHGAFEDVTFTVRHGEILGFAGLVGAGRTETARAVFGADPLDGGDTLVEGVSVRIRSPREAIRHGIVYLTEDRKGLGLFLTMAVSANIVAASQERFSSPAGVLRPLAIATAARQWIEQLDVRPPDEHHIVGRLSGGNQQKVLLAKWLVVGPRVLIADEPTRGVDVGAKARIHRELQRVAASGVGIILISSDLPEVLAISHRIAVFRGGRIAAMLDASTASEELVMRHAAQ